MASDEIRKEMQNHTFEKYCLSQDIKIIYCRFNHTQTNGKLERFLYTYEKRRWEFDTLEEFVHWYNWEKPHLSLRLDNFETPGPAFYNKLTDIIVGNYANMVERYLGCETT
ncbi:MAG: hypothetical protein QW728_03885 [Thermoplasmata archaeon]